MTTKKTATKKTATKKTASKKRRKNPSEAQKRAWAKLGRMAKKRAAEARRLNGTKRKPAKKKATKRAATRKPAKKAAKKNPRKATAEQLRALKKARAARKRNAAKKAAVVTKKHTTKKANPRKAVVTKSKTRPRRNPDAGAIYESFTGLPHDSYDLVTAPAGAPANLDELGEFVEFKWMDADGHRHTVNLESQRVPAKLAASRTSKDHDALWVVSTEGSDLPYFGDFLPEGDVGFIYEITYRAQKAHLSDASPKLYYHRLGEESGQPPIFHIDHEGHMHFKGGEYWIESRGIVN